MLGRLRNVSKVYTVGSVQSWQGAQANRIPWMRAGVGSFRNICQGPGHCTEQKQPRSTCAPWKTPEGVCWLPKVSGWCFPIWTGHTGGSGLPLSQWAGPWAVPLPGELGMKLGSEEGAAREWGNACLVLHTRLTPIPQQRIRQVRPGQQQSPWLIFKRKRLINTSQPKIMRASMPCWGIDASS